MEYGLLAALIAVVILGAVQLFSEEALSLYDYVTTEITSAMRNANASATPQD